MPLHNNASFIPTMNAFLAHWAQVDAAIAPDLVVGVPNEPPITRLSFTALRTTLQNRNVAVIGFLNDKEIARGEIEIQKARLLAHFHEFNGLLEGYWAGTSFINARAYAPQISDGQENFLKPMHDVVSLWEKLNLATAPNGMVLPLVLADSTVIDDFAAEIAALQEFYIAEAVANQNVLLARSDRDETKALVRAVLVTYRKVVPSRCSQFPTLIDTLPTVTPPPGHTPDAVNASAVFQAPDQAKVVYAESAEATLDHYELRGNPGVEYDEEDAVVIASRLPAEPREFLTDFALNQPGTRAAFKVYVVLTTGNEAGSAAMVVARPA